MNCSSNVDTFFDSLKRFTFIRKLHFDTVVQHFERDRNEREDSTVYTNKGGWIKKITVKGTKTRERERERQIKKGEIEAPNRRLSSQQAGF